MTSGDPPRGFIDLLISDSVVMPVILVNAIAMGHLGQEHDFRFQLIDCACVLFFLVEAALKIRRSGFRSYWRQGWNRFDFVVLLLSLPVFVETFLHVQDSVFAIMPLLRTGRLFRLFRMLRFIPNLDHLVVGIRRALRASVGVFLALLLLGLILATGATYLFGRFAPEHFADPFSALYATFRVFTIEGWYEIPELIAERAQSPAWAFLARGYFLLAVLAGGLLGVSLANAVFIDEMIMDNHRGVEARVEVLVAEVRALRETLERERGGSA
jgi:voltage-gated sodium channel